MMMAAAAPKKKKKKKKGKKQSFDPKTLIKPAIWAGVALVVAAILVGIAIWLRTMPSVQAFIERYPGEYELPASAPEGLPVWLNWSHFLNLFFMAVIIRSGLDWRKTTKPDSFFTPVKKDGSEGMKLPTILFIHFFFDLLWIINGAIMYILLFSTGQWMRIVPTSWEVFPNALSAGLQYASLNWPAEDGWVNYNSLQLLAYFIVTFILAPLAIISGYRLSEMWPFKGKINEIYKTETASKIHFPTMIAFVIFVIIHVFLVFATSIANGHGLLGNLSHMFGAQPNAPILGLILFLVALIVTVAAVIFVKPLFIAPILEKFGKVTSR